MEYEIQLKKLRLSRNLSQEEMAKKLGIKTSRYGTWERGERNLSFPQAIACAEILGCSTDDIAGRSIDAGYFDQRQQQINDDYARLSEPLKDAAASSIHGMMLSESARALEERPETDTRCQAS